MNFLSKLIFNPDTRILLFFWLVAGIIFLIIATPLWHAESMLGTPEKVTGYSLFACILALGFFRVRKHLSMFSLVKASLWFTAHTVLGVLALALYVLHVDSWWPQTGYVQLLAALMIAVTITGLLGYIIEKVFPVKLTQQGGEILFSEIPEAIYQLKSEAENLMIEVNKNTASDTLSRHYVETLKWFFQKPRFVGSHIFGGRTADYWLSQQFVTVNRYLDESEKEYCVQLEKLARKKLIIDFSFTLQGIMKLWLLLHVPLSAALILMSLWHLLLVNVYIL